MLAAADLCYNYHGLRQLTAIRQGVPSPSVKIVLVDSFRPMACLSTEYVLRLCVVKACIHDQLEPNTDEYVARASNMQHQARTLQRLDTIEALPVKIHISTAQLYSSTVA